MPPSDTSSSADRLGSATAAQRWRLPFARQAWRGLSGNWAGVGAGSSLDFQDHRVYVPGDDPRHIHWQAFARTGQLTMKLYRAEVSPFVDIVIDVSGSMAVSPGKAARTNELLMFCVESADKVAAPVRIQAARGRRIYGVTRDEVRTGIWRDRMPISDGAGAPPGPVPWRPRAMRILISDLLFAGDPAGVAGPLAAGSGTSIVFAPSAADEADLVLRGNLELLDCESSAKRNQRIDEGLAARYRESYQRHFSLWREACRSRGILFARIPCEPALAHALSGEASATGAVEPTA